MEDNSQVNITSNSGIYDLKADLLTLTDNVHLVSSTGYEVRLSEAVVNVHKGHVVSEKPVWVKLTNGIINAKRMEVSDSGDVIRFGGGVAVTMHPDRSQRRTAIDDASVFALGRGYGIGGAGVNPGARTTTLQRRRVRVSFKTRTRISRSRLNPRRWKCATRIRWRPSPAMCRWFRATPQ